MQALKQEARIFLAILPLVAIPPSLAVSYSLTGWLCTRGPFLSLSLSSCAASSQHAGAKKLRRLVGWSVLDGWLGCLFAPPTIATRPVWLVVGVSGHAAPPPFPFPPLSFPWISGNIGKKKEAKGKVAGVIRESYWSLSAFQISEVAFVGLADDMMNRARHDVAQTGHTTPPLPIILNLERITDRET